MESFSWDLRGMTLVAVEQSRPSITARPITSSLIQNAMWCVDNSSARMREDSCVSQTARREDGGCREFP